MKLFIGTLIFSAALTSYANNSKHSGTGADMNLFPPPQADHTKSTRPGRPTLVEPNYHAKIAAETTTLRWNPVDTATSYHVQVATDPNFKWLVNEQQLLKGTSLEVKGLQKGTHYFWRVAALKENNTPSYMKGWYSVSEFEIP